MVLVHAAVFERSRNCCLRLVSLREQHFLFPVGFFEGFNFLFPLGFFEWFVLT